MFQTLTPLEDRLNRIPLYFVFFVYILKMSLSIFTKKFSDIVTDNFNLKCICGKLKSVALDLKCLMGIISNVYTTLNYGNS